MGAWDAYIGVTATGDADYMNNTICHTKESFAKTGRYDRSIRSLLYHV